MNELKPCPFCGAKENIKRDFFEKLDGVRK
jgi:hypothetical protein